MENINDNNTSEGDPTPENNDDITTDGAVTDETVDSGVSEDALTSDSDDTTSELGGFTISTDSMDVVDGTDASDDTDTDNVADTDTTNIDLAVDEDEDTTEIDADDTDILAAAAELQNEDHWGDSIVDGDDSPQDDVSEPTVGENFAGASAEEAPAPPIPPAPQVAASNRLTRDPFASFGGVLSGIAHNYGWDVALTRIAFIVLLLVTGGTAILAYILAWVLIPRATYWPPAPTQRRGLSSFSGRDIGVGMVALGALVVLGISSGEAAGVLVPLALVGGGIWLLVQNPRTEVAPQMAASNAGAPMAAAYAGSTPTMGGATPPPMQPVPPANYYAPQPPQPAPKRSRLRRVAIVLGIGFIGLMLLAVVLVPLIVIGAIASGDADFEFGGDPIVYTPATIAEIPELIDQDGGEIYIDLTNVDFGELADGADPISLEVNLDAGEIVVDLPSDVRVAVDAETDFVGELDVFGSQTDGISPEVSVGSEDPQLILDLEVNAGRIEVNRETVSN